MNEQMKNFLSVFGRIALSLLLLIWLFSKIDTKHMLEAIKNADMGWMVLTFFVFLSTTFIILWRWRLLMKALGLNASRYDSVRWFFIGQCCNLFLPTSVGGDVVKGLGLSQVTGNKPRVFASIVLDRLSGFSGIVITAVIAFWFGRSVIEDKTVILSIVFMAFVSITLVAVFFSNRIFKAICRVFTPLPKIKQSLLSLHDDLLMLRGHWVKGVESIGLSIVAQLILALTFYLTAKAMHQDINLVYFIIFSPLVCVATSLPSIGGLGVREVGWVYLLSKIGVHEGVALGLSLMNFAFMVIVGLIGALMYVVTLSDRRVQSGKINRKI